MELKKAFELMSVSEDVTIDELEDSYMLWIRRERAQQAQEHVSNPIDIKEINEAYYTIKTHLENKNNTDDGKAKSPLREKLDHYFHYYKFHTLAAIITIAILASLINGVLENRQERIRLANLPPSDLEIMVFGEYYFENITPVQDKIDDQFPEWDRVSVEVIYAPTETRNEMDLAALQKNQITLFTETPDIYIMDTHHFNIFASMGPFLPLDTLDETILGSVTDHNLRKSQTEDDEVERIYGIDITGSHLFEDIVGNDMIVTIRFDAENLENATEFIKRVSSELQN